MPAYELIVFCRPDSPPERLAALFRSLARLAFREAGQVRRVENFGVRPLASPVRAGGVRYDEVRWVTLTYDVPPAALAALETAARADRDVLQVRHLRAAGYTAAFTGRTASDRRKRWADGLAGEARGAGFDPRRGLDARALEAAAAAAVAFAPQPPAPAAAAGPAAAGSRARVGAPAQMR